MKLAGWGRYPSVETDLRAPRDFASLRMLLQDKSPVIARGNGRAYGDSALGRNTTISTRHLNHFLSFDGDTGVLEAEAGVILGDVIRSFLPQGWFPMVTPGTKYVTLGGLIAADVHGKNHHRDGSFRSCVDWIELMDATGVPHRCARDQNPELFDQTMGGMGLTGIITRAAIRLRKVETAWIAQETVPAPSLEAAMEVFEARNSATYSVAWIDCLASGRDLGRSLVMLGEHAQPDALKRSRRKRPFDVPVRKKRRVPVDLPSFLLNQTSVRAFNRQYYRAGLRRAAHQIVDWDSYFYPLDAILGWNRIYGRRGFVQFQCALPLESSEAGLRALLTATARAGSGSFLAVLKRMGAEDGCFSFPMEGYTLALDFPVSERNLKLMKRLDRITIDHGGRFYLAKDARMSAETLRAADARTEGFAAARRAAGLTDRFRSLQSERLSI